MMQFWFNVWFQELMSKFHQEVTVEYVKRLLRGEVKLKDKERQDKAYVTVKNDAERLHSLFIKMVRLGQI